MELQTSHLAPYLPYDLALFNSKYSLIRKMGTRQSDNKQINISDVYSLNYKPVLRRLSSLREDGNFTNFLTERKIIYTIKPITKSDEKGYYKHMIEIEQFDQNHITLYVFFEKLFANQYDVFGLIEKGLAIDINDLKTKSTA